MKKLCSILLLILFLLTIGGCNSGTVEKNNDLQPVPVEETVSVESSSIDTALLPDVDESSEIVSSSNDKSTKKSTEDSSNSESKTTGETGFASTSKNASSSESKSTSKGTSTDKKTSTSKSTTNDTSSSEDSKDQTPAKEESDPNMITVTLSIDTKTAAAKGYVDNEWILGSTKVEIEKGSSVWDALNKVAKSKKIPVAKRGSGDSLYVSHINSIGEFDFEQGSGWMYNVNGTYHNYGCDNSRSVLKNGDVIQWRFTLNIGKDLGAPMS